MVIMETNVRNRIIIKALELFYIQGINSTGINQIIKESKVAKASFYQYFPSKDDLIYECLISYNNESMARLKSIMDSSSTIQEFINKSVSTVKAGIQISKNYNGCPIANARFSMSGELDEKFDEKFRNIITGWEDLLCEFLSGLQKNKKINEDVDIRELSRRMIYLTEGATTMWRLTNDMEYFNDLEKIFEKFF